MKNWIQNRSFLASLFTGGALLIFFFGALWYGVMTYFLRVGDAANAVRWRVNDINLAFLEARRAEKDFMLRDIASKDFQEKSESAYLARHKEFIADVVKDLDVLASGASGGTQEVSVHSRVLVKQYDENFLKLVAAFREKGYKDWGTEGEWRRAVHDIENRLHDAKNLSVTVDLLQLRRDEKDYLLRREDKYIEAVHGDLKKLATTVQLSHIAGSDKITDDLKRYESLFGKYLTIEEKIGKTVETGLEGELRKAAHEVEPLLKKMLNQAVQDSDTARRQLTVSSVVILLVGLVFTSLFFYFFAKSLAQPINQLSAAAASVGDGNLNSRMDFESDNELGVLARGFNHMVEALSKLVGQVQKSGIQISTSITEIAATSKEQQATASEIATTTLEIGATSKEISATSRELVKVMHDVSTVAEQSASLAGSGQEGLAHMEETMRHVMEAAGSVNAKLSVLNEKAGNIGQMVTTITKVADQTNLLSLNAAIEAEKAGEYGRGFAVVATEIRRLADQTAIATYDIEQMVKEIQSAVSAGVMGMDKFSEEVRHGMQEVQHVGGQLSQIIEQVQTLAPRFGAVNEGMQAQSTGAEQISQALAQLSDAAQQTVESLSQSSMTIDQLNQVAGDLRSGVSRFKLQA